jgi:pyruvate ferredoxin oxidoreductase gamma subunit
VDATLLDSVKITNGTPDDAAFIINSSKDPKEIREKINAKSTQRVFTVDATKISIETIGRPMPNASLVGTVTKVSGLLSLEAVLIDVRKSFGEKFPQKIIDGNLEATKRGYEEVKEG